MHFDRDIYSSQISQSVKYGHGNFIYKYVAGFHYIEWIEIPFKTGWNIIQNVLQQSSVYHSLNHMVTNLSYIWHRQSSQNHYL